MSMLRYWIWLSSRPGIGGKTAGRLLDYFGSPESVYFAREDEYTEVDGLTGGDRKTLSDKSLKSARKTLELCEENGYRILTLQDAEYPARLKNIFDPPVLLYIWGNLPVVDEEAAVAIVGTRNCTAYGQKSAERLGYEIAKAGGLVISGLAKGIDTAAAKGALHAGGKVIAVVGSGLDVIYPAENKALFQDVAHSGAVISEYPPKTCAAAAHFPVRNRIISGLSVGVTVVEAPRKSGALITAARALDQGRDVFALPGNVDSSACEGSNKLLREGAIFITSGMDILEEYWDIFPEKLTKKTNQERTSTDIRSTSEMTKEDPNHNKMSLFSTKKVIDNRETVDYIDLVKRFHDLTEDELAVISAISGAALHVDEIIEKSGLAAGSVLATLTILEIRGCVKQETGKRFYLNI